MEVIPAARPPDFWLKKIELEYETAAHKFPKFNSAHEGYAVIKEELDELWELVKKSKQSGPNQFSEQQDEAIQIAAMSLRFLIDLC